MSFKARETAEAALRAIQIICEDDSLGADHLNAVAALTRLYQSATVAADSFDALMKERQVISHAAHLVESWEKGSVPALMSVANEIHHIIADSDDLDMPSEDEVYLSMVSRVMNIEVPY